MRHGVQHERHAGDVPVEPRAYTAAGFGDAGAAVLRRARGVRGEDSGKGGFQRIVPGDRAEFGQGTAGDERVVRGVRRAELVAAA